MAAFPVLNSYNTIPPSPSSPLSFPHSLCPPSHPPSSPVLSMASEPQVSEISALFERLMSNTDLSMFLPFLLGFNQENPDPDPDPEYENRFNPRDRIIIINPSTQGMVVIQGASSFDSLLRELRSKNGQPPASKASIEAMPTEEIREDGDCTICLDEFEIGSRVRKMPCDHKFHGGCIKTWLELHGSCPICRFLLPADEDDVGKKSDREIWVTLSFNGGERNGDLNHSSSNEFDRSSSTSEELEG